MNVTCVWSWRGVCTLETAFYSIGRLSAGLNLAWFLNHHRDDWSVCEKLMLLNSVPPQSSLQFTLSSAILGPRHYK